MFQEELRKIHDRKLHNIVSCNDRENVTPLQLRTHYLFATCTELCYKVDPRLPHLHIRKSGTRPKAHLCNVWVMDFQFHNHEIIVGAARASVRRHNVKQITNTALAGNSINR